MTASQTAFETTGQAKQQAPVAKILAVDDDQANLLALRTILGDLGRPIVCASSGKEALRILLKDDFAVMLLDVRMPGMDGYETAALVRRRLHNRHTPIIFLSAIDKDQSHLLRGYAAGAVDYVFKPIEPVILRAKVAIFLELHAKTQEIRNKAELEKRLLQENLVVRAQQLETAEALRRSLAQQSLVIGSLPLALFMTTPSSGYRSRAFVGGDLGRLFRVKEGELDALQADWLQRVLEEDRDSLLHALGELDASGSVSAEYRFTCGDGSQRWFFERLSLTREGREEGEAAGVMFDITQRKQMEEQLTHAQKMEAIGQMTGGIVHDFNNVLTVVVGGLEKVLSMPDVPSKARNLLELSMQAAMSCTAMTKRLLGFGRRQSLAPRTIDVSSDLMRLRPLLDRVIGSNVTVEIDCPDNLWPIYLDSSQFEAALVNLAINARDAMPAGGRLAFVGRNIPKKRSKSLGADIEPGEFVELSVKDTGIGMSQEIQARALEPFFTTKAAGKGTGLGLSSIHGFLRQSGGGLKISSACGEGTSIILYLPRSRRPNDRAKFARKTTGSQIDATA